MVSLPRGGRLAAAWRESIMPADRSRGGSRRIGKIFHLAGVRAEYYALVLDIGLGTVAAGGGLGVPFAVGGLVFDRLGAAGHALLGGGALGGGEGRGMGRKGSENTPSTV